MSHGKHTIKKENIIYNLDAKNVSDVIGSLSQKFYDNGDIKDVNAFQKAVFERENQIPTSIGNLVAIPHGKSESVNNSTVAFAKLKEPIKWGEKNEDEVMYVFLLSIKESDKGDNHLRTLANLSSNLMDNDFINAIKSSKNIDELYRTINLIDEEVR